MYFQVSTLLGRYILNIMIIIYRYSHALIIGGQMKIIFLRVSRALGRLKFVFASFFFFFAVAVVRCRTAAAVQYNRFSKK